MYSNYLMQKYASMRYNRNVAIVANMLLKEAAGTTPMTTGNAGALVPVPSTAVVPTPAADPKAEAAMKWLKRQNAKLKGRTETARRLASGATSGTARYAHAFDDAYRSKGLLHALTGTGLGRAGLAGAAGIGALGLGAYALGRRGSKSAPEEA